MKKLQVIAPCFYSSADPADLFIRSCRAFHLNASIYGIGEPFIPHGADAQVFRLHKLMTSEKLSETVLITDCRDVLMLARQEEILRNYHALAEQHSARLVMSAERGCWPSEPELVKHYYGRDPNGYDYINAGQYIGDWDYVVWCLEHLLTHYRGLHPGADNSQGWWMWANMKGRIDFALDTGCRIFQSMSGGADAHTEVRDGVLVNKATGSRPCSVHFNGNPGGSECIPQREMYWRLFR